jgi:hypothetical protein
LELPVQAFDSLPQNFKNLLDVGGGKRDRTDDLLHAMQALSQLSYTPLGNQFLSNLSSLKLYRQKIAF